MQKEKLDRPFFIYLIYIIYHELRIQKIIEFHTKVIETSLHLFLSNKIKSSSNTFLLKKIIPFIFSDFSIVFIGYLLVSILTHYPPREIGISP